MNRGKSGGVSIAGLRLGESGHKALRQSFGWKATPRVPEWTATKAAIESAGGRIHTPRKCPSSIMTNTASAYPLTWPASFPRSAKREPGRFKTTLAGSIKNTQGRLRLFAADSNRKLENLVISSNVSLGAQKPTDPGDAVWFSWDGMEVCIAVDRYTSVEANLQAIHYILEARRVEMRHGTLALVRASFSGFKALPAPKGSSWREVLGFDATIEPTAQEIEAKYKHLASAAHPDRDGGSNEARQRLNAARDAARNETKK